MALDKMLPVLLRVLDQMPFRHRNNNHSSKHLQRIGREEKRVDRVGISRKRNQGMIPHKAGMDRASKKRKKKTMTTTTMETMAATAFRNRKGCEKCANSRRKRSRRS